MNFKDTAVIVFTQVDTSLNGFYVGLFNKNTVQVSSENIFSIQSLYNNKNNILTTVYLTNTGDVILYKSSLNLTSEGLLEERNRKKDFDKCFNF